MSINERRRVLLQLISSIDQQHEGLVDHLSKVPPEVRQEFQVYMRAVAERNEGNFEGVMAIFAIYGYQRVFATLAERDIQDADQEGKAPDHAGG